MRNENLISAKVVKNDEFYTMLSDIESELVHYRHHFQNKIVYLPCDNPETSAFWKYFHMNFSELGLKQLTATYYNPNGISCKSDYYGGNDKNIGNFHKEHLRENGDFRSQECQDIMAASDVIVTNEPFSLFRDMMALLIKFHKQFLIIGNFNAVTYKEIFPLLQKNKIWLGCNSVKQFLQPDGSIRNFGNIQWFTNLDIQKKHQFLLLDSKYVPEHYPIYCNYNAINVDRIVNIPCDYYESWEVDKTQLSVLDKTKWNIVRETSDTIFIVPCKGTKLCCKMVEREKNYKKEIEKNIENQIGHILSYCSGIMGVPITFLNQYNPEQFEILGAGLNNSEINIENIPQEWLDLYFKQGNKGHYTTNMHSLVYIHKGKAIAPYKRVLIRKKSICD